MATLKQVIAAELALDAAEQEYAKQKQLLCAAACPHRRGEEVNIVWRNRNARLIIDVTLVRKRKSDGVYEWVCAGYVHPEGRATRTNYRTEITGDIVDVP